MVRLSFYMVIGAMLSLMTAFAQTQNTSQPYDIRKDAPVNSKSFIAFATQKICLVAAQNDVTVSEQFELYGGTGRLVPLKASKTWESAGIKNAWQTVSLAKAQLYEMEDGACFVRSNTKKAWKRRDEVIALIEADSAGFQQVYSGPNQSKTAQRDIFCADYAVGRAAIATLTTINKDKLSSKRSNFQMTIRRFERSCGLDKA